MERKSLGWKRTLRDFVQARVGTNAPPSWDGVEWKLEESHVTESSSQSRKGD